MLSIVIALGLVSPDPTIVDPRDGERYAVVRHGQRDWLDRNLAWTGSGAVCPPPELGGCAASGALYTVEQAEDACPAGWRLPMGDDFRALAASLGGASPSVGAPSSAGQAVVSWGAPGFAIGGRHRAIPGHAIFLQQPEPNGEWTVIGWHRYPVEGGVAFEPTQRRPDDLQNAPSASVRCVRSADRSSAGE